MSSNADQRKDVEKLVATLDASDVYFKMFVNNVHFTLDENDLETYFSQYGCVRSVALIYGDQGLHRGFGFVIFDEDEARRDALTLSKHLVKGHFCDVKPAFEQRSGRDLNKIFVGSVPKCVTKIEILKYFSQFGKVTGVIQPRTMDAERGKFYFVNFKEDVSVAAILNKAEHKLHNHNIVVRGVYPKKGRKKQQCVATNTEAESLPQQSPTPNCSKSLERKIYNMSVPESAADVAARNTKKPSIVCNLKLSIKEGSATLLVLLFYSLLLLAFYMVVEYFI